MAAVSKQPPQPSPSSPPSKDDSWKRNTDCFYFLAPASSCKKGSECEYRHSEAARKNPVDCFYWLSGTCSMNANCGFRHPPLDVLVPPVPPFAQPLTSIPQNAAKKTVPCVYFQGSGCSKGYRCQFLHGPVPQPNTRIPPLQATTAGKEAPAFKKTIGGPEKDESQPKTGFHVNSSKFIRNANAVPEVAKPRPMEVASTVKRNPPHRVIDETPHVREVAAPVAVNGSFRSRVTPSHYATSVDDQYYQNGRDVDDSMRESSPGFDVLVDDMPEEDEYFHDEDEYVQVKGHEGRRSSEFDGRHRVDYDSVAHVDRVDRDVYRNERGYDAYDGLRDKYAREQRGVSSERSSSHDRRGPYKAESTDYTRNSTDLRHRLSKQQRGLRLRSVVSPDYHQKDQGDRSSRRDIRRSPTRFYSVGSRLQGRIKLPRRSPPSGDRNAYIERDNERGRNLRGRNLRRVSPSCPRVSSLQGRLHDRLGARVQEDSFEGRRVRGEKRKDFTVHDNGDAFSAPKRVSEIAGNKRIDNKNQQLRDTVLGSSLRTEGDISFDGPKPLSEILKRKRNAASTALTSDLNCDNKEARSGVHLSEDAEQPTAVSSAPEQIQIQIRSVVVENNEPLVTEACDEDEAKVSNKKMKMIENSSSLPDEQKHHESEDEGVFGVVEGEAEVEEGFNQGDGEEAELDEEFEQGDGEYDYEHDNDVDGYNLNEGDVAGNEGEGFMDEDDGDDFATKLGVSL